MRRYLFAAALAIAVPQGLAAQPGNCSDGTIYDDGTFESGAGWQTFASRGEYVMRVDPPGPNAPLEAVCVCWQRDGTDSQIFFNLNIWAADGANGAPGTLLGTVETLSASGVTTAGSFYRINLASLGITVSSPIYIGPEWAPNDDQRFFVCADTSSSTSQPAYGGSSILGGPPTSRLGQVGFFPEYRNLGIRAKFGAPQAANCTPSATAMCLSNNRFKVEATYETPQGASGAAQVVKLTDDSGYLWFFNAANVEAVVKVINACSFTTPRFWVFAGGLTNVRVVLNVTDTETGNVKTYTNPQRTPFAPIQDTGAFATCP